MRKWLLSIIAIGLVTTAEAIAPKSYSVKFHAAQKFPAMFFPRQDDGHEIRLQPRGRLH